MSTGSNTPDCMCCSKSISLARRTRWHGLQHMSRATSSLKSSKVKSPERMISKACSAQLTLIVSVKPWILLETRRVSVLGETLSVLWAPFASDDVSKVKLRVSVLTFVTYLGILDNNASHVSHR